jgi:hypothetical protein
MKAIQSAQRFNELSGAAFWETMTSDFIFASSSDTPPGQTRLFRLCPCTKDYCIPEDEAVTPSQDLHEESVYRYGGSSDCKDVFPASRYERQ